MTEVSMSVLPVLDMWLNVLLADFLRYTLTAGGAFLVFWVWRPALVQARRLQETDTDWARLRSEIAYSMSTVGVFSGVGLTLLYAAQAGLTRIYTDIQTRGWAYLLASVVLMIVLHDAYFYWTHRLLHWRPLYRCAHHVHHRSTSPTPWAAYAFHPAEAVVQAGVYRLRDLPTRLCQSPTDMVAHDPNPS
jgi:sterol desaturase/sphingolipid hydroxylase (fatty acid hydroxylase superfamily)